MSKALDRLLHYSPYIAGVVTLLVFVAFKHTLQDQLKLVSLGLESLVNIALSYILKRIIRQPRPHS